LNSFVEGGPKNPHLDLCRVLVALSLAVTLTLSTLHAVNIESRWFSRHDSFPDSEVRVAGKRVEAALGNDGDGTSTHGATSVAAKGQALDASDEA
jgi:hypothetical protein